MSTTRRVALWGGIAYLITFLASIPALALLEPVTDHADYVLGAGSDNQVVLGGLFELVTALAGVATALALYPVTRRVSRPAPSASSPPASSRRASSSSASSAS